jgi:hypothetical protein
MEISMKKPRKSAVLFILALQAAVAAAFFYTIDAPVADSPQTAPNSLDPSQQLAASRALARNRGGGTVLTGWGGTNGVGMTPASGLRNSPKAPPQWVSGRTNVPPRQPPQRVLADVGPHWRTWAVGNAPVSKAGRKVMEIGTGMNYWDGSQWTPSDPSFVATGEGFVASRVIHSTHLNADINSASAVTVTVQTTNGPLVLSSTPVAIALYDAASGNSAIIANITSSQGVLISSNKVLYQSCFAPVRGSPAGLTADIVYTMQRGAFHQDVVLTRRVNPADWGFPEKTTRIQVITEFFSAPDPDQMTRPLRVEKNQAVRARMASPDLMDQVLAFGDYVLGTGRAYAGLTGYNPTNTSAVVAKELISTPDNRQFLVESVEYRAAKKFLTALPVAAVVSGQASTFRNATNPRALYAKLPRSGAGRVVAEGRSGGQLMARNDSVERRGFVVDYVANIGGTFEVPITFQKNVTYYVADYVFCNSMVTFESAVFKFPGDHATSIVLLGGAICKTTTCDPAVFTGCLDDTIGDWAAFAPGDYFNAAAPALYCSGQANWSLHDLHFIGPREAIHFDAPGDTSALVANSQFVSCFQVVGLTAAAGSTGSGDDSGSGGSGWAPNVNITLNNCLVTAPTGDAFVADGSGTWTFNNCTIDACFYPMVAANYQGTYNFVNSVLSRTGSFSDGTPVGGQNNGFYQCSDGTFGFGAMAPADGNFPYQPSWYGGYYLNPGSGFQGQGAIVYPDLVGGLIGKSTTPPLLLFNDWFQLYITGEMMLSPQIPRYATGPPDLGYYYDTLDYIVSDFIADGARVTVLPGTSIGVLNYQVGFLVGGGASFVSDGSPNKPITYTSIKYVQEPTICHATQPGPSYDNDGEPWGVTTFASGSGSGDPPSLDFRFCNFYLPPEDAHFWSGGNLWLGGSITSDSVTYWNLRDCLIAGGRVDVGLPVGNSVTWWGTGSINWFNNVFDRADVNLDPYGEEMDWPHTLDLAFQAYNNTFRTANIRVESAYNSDESTWIFKDNIFDQIAFEQDVKTSATLPLTQDYNAYCLLYHSELGNYTTGYSTLATQNARLLVNDPSVDGVNNQYLPGPVPYYSGPLGDFYIWWSTYPTIGRGSRTPADASLYHYTTRLDQVKEGEESAGHMVNIGAHYVATAGQSSAQPRDTDGDGIPDFVENVLGDGGTANPGETSWLSSQTDGVTPDPSSVVYDDIDLDGDGLTGRAEKSLGTNPLVVDNPLAVVGATSSGNCAQLRAQLPAQFDNNDWRVSLLIDGEDKSGGWSSRDNGDGSYAIALTSYFFSPGPHILQLTLRALANCTNGPFVPEHDFSSVVGASFVWVNDTGLWFDPLANLFGDHLRLEAGLDPNVTSYQIDLYDSQLNRLSTISRQNPQGYLQADVDMTTVNNGAPYTGDTAYADVQIAPPPRNSLPVRIKLLRAHGYQSDSMEVAYAWEPSVWDEDHRQTMYQRGVVDVFYNPAFDHNYPNTSLNAYNAYVFGFYSGDDRIVLNEALRSGVGDFFYSGHASDQTFGPSADPHDQLPTLRVDQIGAMLGNQLAPDGSWASMGTTFRFVFLDGCYTAKSDGWAIAFGINPSCHSVQDFDDMGLPYAAFAGWQQKTTLPQQGWGWPNYFPDYELALAIFSSSWMNGEPLEKCINLARSKSLSFPMGKGCKKGNKGYRIYGLPTLTRGGYWVGP